MCLKEENEKKKQAHEHYEMRLGIFADDSSFAAHHFGVLSCVPIECRSHHAGHLIVVSETTPHDTSETVLLKNTPLTRSSKVERRFRSVSGTDVHKDETLTLEHIDSIATRVEFRW